MQEQHKQRQSRCVDAIVQTNAETKLQQNIEQAIKARVAAEVASMKTTFRETLEDITEARNQELADHESGAFLNISLSLVVHNKRQRSRSSLPESSHCSKKHPQGTIVSQKSVHHCSEQMYLK